MTMLLIMPQRGQSMNLYLRASYKNCRTCLKLWMRTGHSTTTLHIVYRLKDTLQAIVITAKHLENQNIFIGSLALSCTGADWCVTQKSELCQVGHTRLDWTGPQQHYSTYAANKN